MKWNCLFCNNYLVFFNRRFIFKGLFYIVDGARNFFDLCAGYHKRYCNLLSVPLWYEEFPYEKTVSSMQLSWRCVPLVCMVTIAKTLPFEVLSAVRELCAAASLAPQPQAHPHAPHDPPPQLLDAYLWVKHYK